MNKKKVYSIEIGRTVIAHFFPWSDQENFIRHAFLIIFSKNFIDTTLLISAIYLFVDLNDLLVHER